ncbi:MAG: glucose 1-dehydrogenase [Myxococcales bacterium]|nr:glucose 1-dehydrogenase [Myxococcales bacterium]
MPAEGVSYVTDRALLREGHMNELKDKVAIVTGGAGGIGLASARRFLEEGASVLLVDLDPERVEAAVSELKSERVRGLAVDAAAPDSGERCVAEAVAAFGGVDVLFANAGIEGRVGPIVQSRDEDFERVFAVNVLGVVRGVRAAAPQIAARGGGSIVVTASIASLIGSPGLAPYVASKHAIFGFVKAAAVELAPMGIRVNAIAPGPIDNRMMRSIEEQAAPGHAEQVKAGFTAQVPLGRYGTNEEIADMALFLASARSRYSTGAIFLADGGFVVQ